MLYLMLFFQFKLIIIFLFIKLWFFLFLKELFLHVIMTFTVTMTSNMSFKTLTFVFASNRFFNGLISVVFEVFYRSAAEDLMLDIKHQSVRCITLLNYLYGHAQELSFCLSPHPQIPITLFIIKWSDCLAIVFRKEMVSSWISGTLTRKQDLDKLH